MYGDLTDRQRQFLEYIQDFIMDRGYPPSIREIQKAFGLKSTKGVKDHIDRLVDKGYLNREDGSARAISLPDDQRFRDTEDPSDTAPIIGRVAAGAPILAEENEEGRLPVPDRFRGVKGQFWLRVRGDSMIDDGIHHGDMVLVHPAPFVDQGAIAVVMVDDEATVKRFFRTGNSVELVPGNAAYSPMVYSGGGCEKISLVGRVAAVLRILD